MKRHEDPNPLARRKAMLIRNGFTVVEESASFFAAYREKRYWDLSAIKAKQSVIVLCEQALDAGTIENDRVIFTAPGGAFPRHQFKTGLFGGQTLVVCYLADHVTRAAMALAKAMPKKRLVHKHFPVVVDLSNNVCAYPEQYSLWWGGYYKKLRHLAQLLANPDQQSEEPTSITGTVLGVLVLLSVLGVVTIPPIGAPLLVLLLVVFFVTYALERKEP